MDYLNVESAVRLISILGYISALAAICVILEHWRRLRWERELKSRVERLEELIDKKEEVQGAGE